MITVLLLLPMASATPLETITQNLSPTQASEENVNETVVSMITILEEPITAAVVLPHANEHPQSEIGNEKKVTDQDRILVLLLPPPSIASAPTVSAEKTVGAVDTAVALPSLLQEVEVAS